MAEVTVFVDDAVLGRLPGVCAKDGVPTADRLTVRAPVGDGARMGVLWLLLLAGPIGWIAFFLMSGSRNGQAEVLTVDVPMSSTAYQRVRDIRARQSRTWLAIGGGIALLVLQVGADATTQRVLIVAGLVLVVWGLVTTAVLSWRRDRECLVVRLDASRRWVTLGQVHPAFASACAAHRDRERQDR
jgi:hypothetical protein